MRLDDYACGKVLQLDGRGGFVLLRGRSISIPKVESTIYKALTIFCPPGPLPLRKASSISASSTSGRGGTTTLLVDAVVRLNDLNQH